jgi:hypothetical protein
MKVCTHATLVATLLATACGTALAQGSCEGGDSKASTQVKPSSLNSDQTAASLSFAGSRKTSLALKIGGNAAPLANNACITHSLTLESGSGLRRARLVDSEVDSDAIVATYAWHFKKAWDTKGLHHSLGFSLGQQDHKYFDGQTLAKGQQRQGLWSISLGSSYSFESERGTVSLEYEAGRSHESAASKTLCPVPAPGSSAPVVCVTGPIGAPTLQRSRVLSAGATYLVSRDVQLELQFNYDLESKLKTVALPISVMAKADANGDRATRGGVQLSWDSDARRARWSLFVATPFKVL